MEPTRGSESGSIPDLLFDAEKDLTSINLFEQDVSLSLLDSNFQKKCTLLLDQNECLRLNDINAFIKKLGISDENKMVKVRFELLFFTFFFPLDLLKT